MSAPLPPEISDPAASNRLADRVASSWTHLGRRLKNSQIRAEIRRLEQRSAKLRTEMARNLLGSADLPAQVPLTPRLTHARQELRRVASEIEETLGARDAERERERLVEEERAKNVDPLRQAVEAAQREREDLRQREERAAREGLAIARRREILDRELQAAPVSAENEFDTLRRRHAVEELEAIERRASQLTLERDHLSREIGVAERRLAAARDEHQKKAAEWDSPLAEARAHRQASESRLTALERRQRAVFDDVAAEATIWGESWRKVAQSHDDAFVRRTIEELDEIESRRTSLVSQLAAGGGSAAAPEAGDAKFFLWVIAAGAGMLLVTAIAGIVLTWLWMRSGERSARAAARPAAIAVDSGPDLAALLRSLAERGALQKTEEIVTTTIGAVDGKRIYPFADEAAAIEIYAFASEAQAKEARRRMARLLPDPRDSFFAENSDQFGRFVVWGIAQLSPRSRRLLKAALHSAASA